MSGALKPRPIAGSICEDVEEIRGGAQRLERNCFPALDKIHIAGNVIVGSCRLETVIATTHEQGHGTGISRPHVAVGIRALDPDQLLRVREGQRTEQDAIEDEKNREVGSDAQGQREHGSEGKSGALTQLPQRIHDVLPKKACCHHADYPPPAKVSMQLSGRLKPTFKLLALRCSCGCAEDRSVRFRT